MKILVFCVIVAFQSIAMAGNTANVEEFEFRGIKFGMTVDEVLDVLTPTYSTNLNDYKLVRDEKPLVPTGDKNLLWSIRYRSEKLEFSIDFYPDLDIKGDDYMVVNEYTFRDIGATSLEEKVAKATELYGPHTLVKNSVTGKDKDRKYFWCSKIKKSKSGNEFCDDSVHYLEVSRSEFDFETSTYQDKYFKFLEEHLKK